METIVNTLEQRVREKPNAVCLKFKSERRWKGVTWKEYGMAVEEIALGFLKWNIIKGDRIALLAATRPQWSYSDLAILSVGAVSVPIYPSNTASDVNFILRNSGAKALVIENAKQLEKIDPQNQSLTGVVVMDWDKNIRKEAYPFPVLSLEDFRKAEKNGTPLRQKLGAIGKALHSEDLATIVYTSGTTGNPKGVMLKHRQITSELSALSQLFKITSRDVALTFLPYAHIFGRVEQFGQIWFGWTAYFAESLDTIAANIAEAKPTVMFSVPRIYEKAYQRILNQVKKGSALKRTLFSWALSVGEKMSAHRETKKMVPPPLWLQYSIAYALVFSKLNKRFGGRIRFFISGGAPLSKEIARFFHAAGILILEGYGLTETTAALSINVEEDYRFGSVGKTLPGVQVRIAPDGEILVKGEIVFSGYFGNEEETKAVLKDGWFHTGDIGEIDQAGFVRITDRKKDLIVTSGGKNIAPQKIENLLKNYPLVSQVLVHGDKRHYLTALITLNPEVVQGMARNHSLNNSNYGTLIHQEAIQQAVKQTVREVNAGLASFEQIKHFRILDREFTIDEGELTPSLKIKRRVCERKFEHLIEEMYA